MIYGGYFSKILEVDSDRRGGHPSSLLGQFQGAVDAEALEHGRRGD